MVDPEDLALVEVLRELRVQRAGGVDVVPERLLDDQPHPAARSPASPECVDKSADRIGRNREVVDAVLLRPALLVELVQRLCELVFLRVVREVHRQVAHPVGERLPHVVPELVAPVLLHRLLHLRDPGLGRLLAARDADDRELRRQEAAEGQRVKRREELALRQVARGAEDDEHARLGRPHHAQALEERVLLLLLLGRSH